MWQWSARSFRRTATLLGVRSSFRGFQGLSPRPGWSTGSAQKGREANPEQNFSAKMTGSLVMSNDVTVSGLTMP